MWEQRVSKWWIWSNVLHFSSIYFALFCLYNELIDFIFKLPAYQLLCYWLGKCGQPLNSVVTTGDLASQLEVGWVVTLLKLTMERQKRDLRRSIKGLHARFLWTNPRFINEPVCNLVNIAPHKETTTKMPISAALCMQWGNGTDDLTKISHRLVYSRSRRRHVIMLPSPMMTAAAPPTEQITSPTHLMLQQLNNPTRKQLLNVF